MIIIRRLGTRIVPRGKKNPAIKHKRYKTSKVTSQESLENNLNEKKRR